MTKTITLEKHEEKIKELKQKHKEELRILIHNVNHYLNNYQSEIIRMKNEINRS